MRDQFCLRDERGFTLIEMMFSMVLLSFLFIIVWGIYAQGVIFWKQSEYKVDMYDSLQVSLDRMGRELMYARQPTGSISGGVQTPSDSHNLYFINSEGNNICYNCNGVNLYRKENSAPKQPLASDIQDVSFKYYYYDPGYINPTTGKVKPASTVEERLKSIERAKTIKQVKIVLTAKKQGSTVNPAVLVQKINLRSL